MGKSCVLLDFDGVIADTEPHNADYLARALAAHGVVLTGPDRLALVGTNDRASLAALAARARPPLDVGQLMAERRALGNFYEDGAIAPMPGLLPFLRRLRGRGWKTGIVSSTSTRLIIAALNRMGMTALFDVIVCGDMVERHKPAPDCYEKAMGLLGIGPGECVVIEDSPVGIEAARRTGAYVIAYKGASVRQDTRGADAQIDSFDACAALPLFSAGPVAASRAGRGKRN